MHRKVIKKEEEIGRKHLLNEEEQEEVIRSFAAQDARLNTMYKVLLCGLSVVLALFFYVSYRDSSAAVIAIISCAVAPVFVLLSSQELLENIGFQAAFLAFFVFSLVPLLVVGLDLVFCLPGLLVLFDLMIIRDMYLVRKELGNLEKRKYILKGA